MENWLKEQGIEKGEFTKDGGATGWTISYGSVLTLLNDGRVLVNGILNIPLTKERCSVMSGLT